MILVFHPRTQLAVADYIARPTQALLITGPYGSGKASVARYLTTSVLDIDGVDTGKYEDHPYIRTIRPVDGKAIPIETIRNLQHFLSLSVPGSKSREVSRVVVIENAQLLTTESQNALLKTLEEPPPRTIIVLTAISRDAVLPTIQSRVRQLIILPPPVDLITSHFLDLGYSNSNIDRALTLSGELPGLASALLAKDSSHPLVAATTHARGILQSKTYERLLLVDSLSKQKPLCTDILFVLGQMSRTALLRNANGTAAQRWQRIMRASFQASQQLSHNSQTKLVLTNLMLEL